jgi:B-cell receptor-associated protein 31
MIQLFFTVLAAEAAVASTLLFKTPLRKLAVLALDRLKRGRGPIMARTVAATVLVLLASSLHTMAQIRGRAEGELDGAGVVGLTPTDQVLLSRHLLEASLMGTYVRARFLILVGLLLALIWSVIVNVAAVVLVRLPMCRNLENG